MREGFLEEGPWELTPRTRLQTLDTACAETLMGAGNTLCFQGTRILVILLYRIHCEIPVLHGPHTEQVLRKGGVGR